jgi:hypothetical protein
MKEKIIIYFMILSLLLVSGFTGCSRNTGGNGRTPGSNNELLDCNWVLNVDQTIPVKDQDGMTVEYTLVLIAEKEGGTDVSGTYHGAAYIGAKLDISEFSNEAVEMTGGFDLNAFGNDISFDVVPYEIESYSNYGVKKGEIGIAPLVKYETMALLSPEMTGAGVINPYLEGRQEGSVSGGYTGSATGTEKIPMKITINSGKVRVDIPSFKIGKQFEGQLLGVPIGDSKQYDDTIKKIEELKEKSEGHSDTPSGEGSEGGLDDLGGLGGIMGQMGTNLEMPDSFPVDDIPVMSDANIINVYENDTKKNVRIMFGIDKAYDEVLEFYQNNFLDKLEEEPSVMEIDGGIMYRCDAEGYRNITIMIMEDPSKTYKSMVMLEVLKK